MKPEIAHKLADELESGRWRKARGQLGRGTNQRCCLGVPQEMAPRGLPRRALAVSWPSPEVRDWAGLRRHEMSVLADMNDKKPGWGKVIEYLRGVKE